MDLSLSDYSHDTSQLINSVEKLLEGSLRGKQISCAYWFVEALKFQQTSITNPVDLFNLCIWILVFLRITFRLEPSANRIKDQAISKKYKTFQLSKVFFSQTWIRNNFALMLLTAFRVFKVVFKLLGAIRRYNEKMYSCDVRKLGRRHLRASAVITPWLASLTTKFPPHLMGNCYRY